MVPSGGARCYGSSILVFFGWVALTGASIPHHRAVASINSADLQTKQTCAGTTRPDVSCEAISAQAAIEQARDADRQATIALWQTALGALTLIAAIAAAIFAGRAAHHGKRSADVAEEAIEEAKATSSKSSANTLEALSIARENADAAAAHVSVAQESSRRELRAYVGVDEISFEVKSRPRGYEPINLAQPGVVYLDFVTVSVKNFGHTPATGVCCFVGIATVPFLQRLPDNYDFEGPLTPNTDLNITTRHFLQAGQIEKIKCGLGDVRALWGARKKQRSIFLFGRIYYIDAFENSHSTKFCHTWEPWHPHGERFVPTDRFNGEDSRQCPL